MLNFYNKNNLNKSKKKLLNNFNNNTNNIIKTKNNNNLKITSYNVHYFMPGNLSQTAINKNTVISSIKKLILFCKKSQSDIILLQEALFNKEILSTFKDNLLIPYVCQTYSLINTNEINYQYGNIILINNSNIKIKNKYDIPISGFHNRKKCIVNLVIEYLNNVISIYNVHLDVWDRTGKCRLEQIDQITKIIKQDSSPNIIIAGDFNSIKEEDYNPSQILALKEFYQNYTNNPFKEIKYFIKNGFIDIASLFQNKISPTVWSKQRVDFFFINKNFSLPIYNYDVTHLKGSDHFPISIELNTNNCINQKLLSSPTKNAINFYNPEKIQEFLYKIIDKETNCPMYMKILPIWNERWEGMVRKIYKNEILKYGKEIAYNEYTITTHLSLLTQNFISLNFPKTFAAFQTNNLSIDSPINIDEQKYYIMVQPEYAMEKLNLEYSDLIVFQLQWSIFISFKIFKFIHGDILNGRNHNIFTYNYKFPNKNATVFKYENKIWKFPINGLLPTIIQYDFGFSDFHYKNININNKIPYLSTEDFPIGNNKTSQKKIELDNQGYNLILQKIGINHKIPINIEKLLDGFDKYIITQTELDKLDKKDMILLDGNKKI